MRAIVTVREHNVLTKWPHIATINTAPVNDTTDTIINKLLHPVPVA